MKLLVSLKKIWHLLNFNKSFFVIGKTEEVQTFSFETGDDEKYELIEGSHTFQSEVQSIRTEVKTFINCSIRKRKRRAKVW